jgi:hypothetical protein
MTTRFINKNKNVQPAAVIRVWHEGKNDYRVQIDGAGDYCRVTQLGYAVQKTSWLAALSGEDFGHEVLKIVEARCAAGATATAPF